MEAGVSFRPGGTAEGRRGTSGVVHNFEVSVVMPFYKKMREFRRVLPLNAPYFERNGVEVVIVMDEDGERDELLGFIDRYPFINWKVVVNPKPHAWRNPAKPINVGIRHATKRYVLVCSPESEFHTDAIRLMRQALEHYPRHFAVGHVAFAGAETPVEEMDFHLPYGSIMALREDFLAVRGYDERLLRWGGDDDNVRARLELYGVRKLVLPEVRLVHREFMAPGTEGASREEKKALIPKEEEYRMLHPERICANGPDWGLDFDRVAYDWRHKGGLGEGGRRFLEKFECWDTGGPEVFRREYRRLVLAQVYNEASRIGPFLEDMGRYFDGVVLLDDGSTDGTYGLARHPKLLLKARKKRTAFLDIQNRNLLLDLASLFSCEWLCFMDADERFDPRFADFEPLMRDRRAEVVAFHSVQLWDDEEHYNGDYPYSDGGIVCKVRMFRNIGHARILTDKILHFDAVPHRRNEVRSRILYLHSGMLRPEDRRAKHDFYRREDVRSDQKDYGHMLNPSPRLLRVDGIVAGRNGFSNRALRDEGGAGKG